ncbi:MAG: AAA family ATPase [Planctomycetota bacterium]
MAVDLSGAFASRFEREVEGAKAAEAGGDLARAASLYRQAARSLEKLAPSVRSDGVRRDMASRAENMKRKAAALERGESPELPRSGEATSQRTSEADSVREAVLGMLKKSSVGWDDIAGLDEVKRRIRASYAMALAARPEGVEVPSAGNLLLYGPPGTGKTMLAAAVSGQLGAAFFAARFSDLLSKWFGESSKIVAELFAAAREKSPSVVFLDDFEALVAAREGDSTGAERRVLGELLVALDGLEAKGAAGFVLTIAATNKPWLVDEAVLSRFGLRVCVPLPAESARKAMFEIHLARKGYELTCPAEELARATDGYSGREIEALARAMITDMLLEENPDLEKARGADEAKKLTLKTRPLGPAALDRAKAAIKPSTATEALARYDEWTRKFGAGM